MTIKVDSQAQWRQILSANSIVITDCMSPHLPDRTPNPADKLVPVHADWCGPCKMIAPTFESLSTRYSKPNRIAFAKVDVDAQQAVAQQYGVRAMPTFLILRNGSVIDTIQGANPPALTAAVDKAVKLAGGAAPGASFATAGRTLGGPGTAATRPSGTPRQGLSRPMAWDFNALVNTIITFFGLYFSSLFSVRNLFAPSPYKADRPSARPVHGSAKL